MCGIIAAFNNEKQPVNEWVINKYEDQFSRGDKGFGIVTIDNKMKIKVMRATEPAKMMFDMHLNPAPMILMHHRWPTSSANTMDQTHPILVSNGSLKFDYLVIHNGVVGNDDELKEEHEKLGFCYNTAYKEVSAYSKIETDKFNDSEALAIEVARFIENQTDKIGARGSAAFVALQIKKDKKNKGKVNKVFFGRNEGNPLILQASNKKILLSSEGSGDDIKAFELYSFTPGKTKFTKRKMTFATYPTYPLATVYPTTPSCGIRTSDEFGFSAKDKWSHSLSDKYGTKVESKYPDAAIEADMQSEYIDEEVDLEMAIEEFSENVDHLVEEYKDSLRETFITGAYDSEFTIKSIAAFMQSVEAKVDKIKLNMVIESENDYETGLPHKTANSLLPNAVSTTVAEFGPGMED